MSEINCVVYKDLLLKKTHTQIKFTQKRFEIEGMRNLLTFNEKKLFC